MKIIADQNIPFAKEAFSSLGEVELCNGVDLSPEKIRNASILLVRSVTEVNKSLLDGSSIKFVASATIGRDHVDEEYLKEQAIGFTTAPGSNANSVVEYVLTAMASQCVDLSQKSLAIVGVGNIGSLLYEKSTALGMKTFLNDPPKAHDFHSFLPLKEALQTADFVSLHVPLNYSGKWPTHGLINDTFLGYMKDGAQLINASRGKTLVEEALLKHADRLAPYILDVWPDEPSISDALLEKCVIATPHIAGYSFDGKCRGTELIYQAVCSFFFKEEIWQKKEVFKTIERKVFDFSDLGSIEKVLTKAYDIYADTQSLKDGLYNRTNGERDMQFNLLRKEYPRRLEFKHFTITGCSDIRKKAMLKALGFHLEE